MGSFYGPTRHTKLVRYWGLVCIGSFRDHTIKEQFLIIYWRSPMVITQQITFWYTSPWCCCSHIGYTVVTNTRISTRHVDTVATFTSGRKLGLNTVQEQIKIYILMRFLWVPESLCSCNRHIEKNVEELGKVKAGKKVGRILSPPRPSSSFLVPLFLLTTISLCWTSYMVATGIRIKTRQLSRAQKYASIADYSLYHKLHSVKRKERCNDRLHKNGLYITSEHFLLICFVLTVRQNRQNTLDNSPKQCR